MPKFKWTLHVRESPVPLKRPGIFLQLDYIDF